MTGTGAPQATPRRAAVGVLLIAAAVALLTWGAWQHHAGTCVLACVSITIGLSGLYYAAVARGATR